MLDENDRSIWLTKRGRFFADEVATQFFNADYMPFEDIVRAPQRIAANA
jgi:hypothetical protein